MSGDPQHGADLVKPAVWLKAEMEVKSSTDVSERPVTDDCVLHGI